MPDTLTFIGNVKRTNFGVNGCDSAYFMLGDPKFGYAIPPSSVESAIIEDLLKNNPLFNDAYKKQIADKLQQAKGVSFEWSHSDESALNLFDDEISKTKYCSIYQKPDGVFHVGVAGDEIDTYYVKSIPEDEVVYLPFRCFTMYDHHSSNDVYPHHNMELRCDTPYFEDAEKAMSVMKYMTPVGSGSMDGYQREYIGMYVGSKSELDNELWYMDSQRVNKYQDQPVYQMTFVPNVHEQVQAMRRRGLDMTLDSEKAIRAWNEQWAEISGAEDPFYVESIDDFDYET